MSPRKERQGRTYCTDCGLYFVTAGDYNAHRKHDYLWKFHCISLDAMLGKGMECNRQGFWFIPKAPT